MRHLYLSLALVIAACGSWQGTARHTLAVSAHALNTVEQVTVVKMRAECGQAITAPAVRACYESGYDDVARAVAATDHLLRAAQASLDAETQQAEWIRVAACISLGLAEIGSALTSIGVELPAALRDALTYVGTFGHASCVDPFPGVGQIGGVVEVPQ